MCKYETLVALFNKQIPVSRVYVISRFFSWDSLSFGWIAFFLYEENNPGLNNYIKRETYGKYMYLNKTREGYSDMDSKYYISI